MNKDEQTQTTFGNVDLSADPPDGVCRECARRAMIHNDSGFVAAYCTHTEIGAMRYPGRDWETTARGYPLRTFRGDVALHALEIDATLNESDATRH